MKEFYATMKDGCTVVLVPEFRRVGCYIVGLKMYQPYRCHKIIGAKIWILTSEGIRPYPLHCFDPFGCKFGLHEKVRIFNPKRSIYSSVMKVVSYTKGAYLLSNGNIYDAKYLSLASDAEHVINIKQEFTQSTINF